MSVRAKVVVDFVGKTRYGHHTVRLSPVTSGSEENKRFFKHTPSGNLELSVVSDETANLFEPGKEFYLDFTPADESADSK